MMVKFNTQQYSSLQQKCSQHLQRNRNPHPIVRRCQIPDQSIQKSIQINKEEISQMSKNNLPNFEHPVSASEFKKIMHQLTDFICEYYEGEAEKLPVRSQVQKGEILDKIPKDAPMQKEEWDAIWKDFQNIVMPGITHWQSPNFFAYFPANSSYPSILGEVLNAAINMIGFSWVSSPAATELEMAVMDQIARLVQLPEKFMNGKGEGVGGGVIQGTASEALLVAIIAARERKIRGLKNKDDQSKLVVYSSDQAHSSLQKNCQILGISNLRFVPTSKDDDWALNPSVFKKVIEEDINKGLIPCILQINVGTTSTAAVDPVLELAQICSKYDIWSHVDAAYAGNAAICPEIRQQYFNGIEEVDSFNFNLHKWFLTNFDCSALWVSDSNSLKNVLAITPVFLRAEIWINMLQSKQPIQRVQQAPIKLIE
eukprot:TRINITY_DN8833_c0_g1_i5.p1 TRINITY_DN8833_c0_g1~~TRINITY_DN8833_c0_g1_i5.p1  ORF type:complete len:426 (+),score=38.61 TRINITY_DN8833_c0_g1_i5:180-1457(+)